MREIKRFNFGEMMKISKPVLMNDFAVSHVQFTSLNLVNFKNIKPVYNGNEKILLEFEYPSKIEVPSRDWIGIFPRGWTNIQQYVTFEWTSQSIIMSTDQAKEEEYVRRTIVFCPKYHINCVNQRALYQFVYVGKQIEVLGVSSYFRFNLTCLNDNSLELECLVPVTGKIRSTSVSDFGTLSMKNEQSSTSVDSRKLIQASSIHSLQNLDIDGKLSWSRMNFTDDKKNMCLLNRATLTSGTGDTLDPYSSHSEPVFPMSLPLSQCKKCYQFKRGGEFLRSQQALQSKVGPSEGFVCHRRTHGNAYFPQDQLKIVMERNKILEERAQETKKGLERLQGESKRMKMLYYNANKEKIVYEKFVKDFIKSLEKDSIVRVMYGNTEILVKKVNYVGVEEHPRNKKTSKRERELKAVIGLQEITIRNLTNSLQEKAKSAEELNQAVKLAQMFSMRSDNRDLDAEESGDELSNSDLTSEYEFSLAKPKPPEEVPENTDKVLDNIRRKSEMELKNIGISRSLGTDSDTDLDVTNLSVMTYSEDEVTKKPRLMDNGEDCWPFPKAPTKTVWQKLSEGYFNITEEGNVSNGGEKESVKENVSAVGNDEEELDLDMDTTVYEDYYDACEALSVRSFAPEPEATPEEPPEENCKNEEETGFVLVQNNKEDVPQVHSEENVLKYIPQKYNKFTCQFSIDWRKSDQMSDRMICDRDRSEKSLLALVPSETGNGKICTLERERSLIKFAKSDRCLEIKITKIEEKENSSGGLQHKIILQFAGNKKEQDEKAQDNVTVMECIEAPVEETVGEPKTDEANKESMEVDFLSPRTEWIDANEAVDEIKIVKPIEDVTHSIPSQEVEDKSEKGMTVIDMEERSEEKTTVMELEEKNNETSHQLAENNCNNQLTTDDNVKNLKIYQDSLRYEKNLQFLNNKFDCNYKESEDGTLKEKPSAILIQSGQAKVAVIRYQ